MNIKIRALGEDGSLPMVLLAAIIMAGVVIALFTTVRTGVDTAQRDRDVAAAFQVADAGLQEAYVDLLGVDIEALDPSDPGHQNAPCKHPEPGSTVGEGECTKTLPSGDTVTWEYSQIGETRRWIVVARGDSGRSEQVVRAQMGQDPSFAATLVSLNQLDLNGLGTAVSGATCNIDNFALATSGQITVNGHGGACLNGVTLYEGASTPDLGDSGDDVEIVETGEELTIPNKAAEAFDSGECETLPTVPDNGQVERGQTYCIGSLTTSHLEVTGEGEDPAIIYVQNEAAPGNFATWNDVSADVAKDLQIHVAGAQGFTLGPNRRVRAAITAPAGPCTTNGFGANGLFQGGMACNSITVNGNFNYDPSIFDIFEGQFKISLFSQEARSYVESS